MSDEEGLLTTTQQPVGAPTGGCASRMEVIFTVAAELTGGSNWTMVVAWEHRGF
jgi:hypothetical protein